MLASIEDQCQSGAPADQAGVSCHVPWHHDNCMYSQGVGEALTRELRNLAVHGVAIHAWSKPAEGPAFRAEKVPGALAIALA